MAINLCVLHFSIAKDVDFNWLFFSFEVFFVFSSVSFCSSGKKKLQKCSELQRRSQKDFVFATPPSDFFSAQIHSRNHLFCVIQCEWETLTIHATLRRSRMFRISCLEHTIERTIFGIILKSSTLHCGCNYCDEWYIFVVGRWVGMKQVQKLLDKSILKVFQFFSFKFIFSWWILKIRLIFYYFCWIAKEKLFKLDWLHIL